MKTSVALFLGLIGLISIGADPKNDPPVISSTDDLDVYVGKVITIRGKVLNSKIPRIMGIDVQSDDPDLRGKEAEATGILQRWEVTAEQIAKANYANRGSGIFYRLKAIDSNYAAQVTKIAKD